MDSIYQGGTTMMSPAPTAPAMLNATQVEAAAHVLARAFRNDPLMVYVMPNEEKRQRLLPALFRIPVHYCLRYGIIYTAPDLDGLACCLPPGQSTTTTVRLALASLRSIPVPLGLTGLRRFLNASKHMDSAHKQAAPGAHWYLWALGVNPERQGQGLGSQLLQTVIRQAGTQCLPCYLDTQNPRNVPFYQQYGFRQVSETTISGSDVHVYAMLWEPGEAI
jgi:ribosomal protein S18 acetylase RimI-like enzyme